MTLIAGGIVLIPMLIMFYIEKRMGGGLYDPDPSASFRYQNRKK